jgi:hypothetical protein
MSDGGICPRHIAVATETGAISIGTAGQAIGTATDADIAGTVLILITVADA